MIIGHDFPLNPAANVENCVVSVIRFLANNLTQEQLLLSYHETEAYTVEY